MTNPKSEIQIKKGLVRISTDWKGLARKFISLLILSIPFYSFLFLLLISSFVICHLSLPAVAYPKVFPAPALNGASGVVRIPSADVIPYKNFNIAADYGTFVASKVATAEPMLYYKMNLGAFHGLELGVVGGLDPQTDKLREGVFVNMKLSLSTGEEPDPLLLAIGVENLFSYTQADVYMVATKSLKQGPKLTFGFMADFPDNKFRPLGMAGLEVPMGETLFLASDLLLGESVFQVDAGVKFYFTPIFSLNVSGINILENPDAPQGKDSRSIFAGFSWANPF